MKDHPFGVAGVFAGTPPGEDMPWGEYSKGSGMTGGCLPVTGSSLESGRCLLSLWEGTPDVPRRWFLLCAPPGGLPDRAVSHPGISEQVPESVRPGRTGDSRSNRQPRSPGTRNPGARGRVSGYPGPELPGHSRNRIVETLVRHTRTMVVRPISAMMRSQTYP